MLKWIILIVVSIIVLWFCIKFLRHPKTPCVLFLSGEVKGGKTMLALYMAIRKYKKVHLLWRIKCFLRKLFHIDGDIEEPVLCSNIPIAGVPFVLLTKEIIKREHRLPFKSVTFISESHLVIDSMNIKNALLNEQATLFYKLYGHTTHGGYCYVESQSISDNHYSLKRSVSRYYAIYSNIKLRFIGCFLQIRELAYSEDSSMVNVNLLNRDISYRWLFIPWKIVKQYDCYTYSTFTDDKPVIKDTIFYSTDKKYRDRLKTKKLVSFRTFHSLDDDNVM